MRLSIMISIRYKRGMDGPTELASRAGRLLGDVAGGHGGIERVASNDLVHVRGGDQAGVDEGVEPVDDDIRAAEPKHRHAAAGTAELRDRRGERREAKERSPLHDCNSEP